MHKVSGLYLVNNKLAFFFFLVLDPQILKQNEKILCNYTKKEHSTRHQNYFSKTFFQA